MDRTNVPRRLLRLIGRLATFAARLSLTCAAPAFADQLEQHNDLVSKFVNEMHADPLVADCAAHGNFVASTSTAFDHVEFPPSSFDTAHASITPWNDSFDEGKQRVKVDNIVTVEGLGIRQSGTGDPADLKFRCGYVGQQMLAFSWNDPVPPARAQSSRSSDSHSAASRHKAAKGKHVTSSKSSKKATTKSSKSTAKKKKSQ
ncbi:MAG: Putative transmembrane lipoprotein [uncultured Paraburkholderia sp.]|nr:MAG: Putative transmembrane lipoprotein [uncultured Paraburkholderia sp.]CAH2945647.1 MAG: Putative transmembrane lipoprotein [uncultured Paraburkholderia sp.]